MGAAVAVPGCSRLARPWFLADPRQQTGGLGDEGVVVELLDCGWGGEREMRKW